MGRLAAVGLPVFVLFVAFVVHVPIAICARPESVEGFIRGEWPQEGSKGARG
jgi:hypothetical protein